jgi:PAS domain S-box-containing protein
MSDFQLLETTPQEGKQLLSAIFEQTAVGLAYLSLDGQWLQVNQKLGKIVGYSREQLLARSSLKITHPDDRDTDRELMQKLIAGEILNYTIEKRFLHREGYQVWVNLTLSRVQQPSGKPPILLAVTPRRRTRQTTSRPGILGRR